MEIKRNLPLLPLRDIVVFPSMVIPLFVGRDKSISALNEVMQKEKKIILITQKNSEVDDPKKNDIFSYGCESNILQLLKLPDGTVKVLVEGYKRVKIIDFKVLIGSSTVTRSAATIIANVFVSSLNNPGFKALAILYCSLPELKTEKKP